MTTYIDNPETAQRFGKLRAAYLAQAHYIECVVTEEPDVDAASDQLLNIERQLWDTPAPDLTAVLVKMEIACQETDMPPMEAIRSIIDDLRSMSCTDVSPIFQADVWLSSWESRGGSYFTREGQAILCGDPTNPSQRRLTRVMESANGAEAVKAMIFQCCKGLPEGLAE